MIVAHRPRPITCPSTIEAAKTKNAEEHHPSGAGNDETGGRALAIIDPAPPSRAQANHIGGERLSESNVAQEPQWIEVPDIPFCNEPDYLYNRRMLAGMQISELRHKAGEYLGKPYDELTADELVEAEKTIFKRWDTDVSDRPVRFGTVRQATIKDDMVLIPLISLGYPWTQDLAATIAYDLIKLGYTYETVKFYCKIAKNNAKKAIIEYVEARGRMVVPKSHWDLCMRRVGK